MTADREIDVPSGETLRIDYLSTTASGDVTLKKLGDGRLEIGVINSGRIHIAATNGTLAIVQPSDLDFSQNANVVFHLDATKTASFTTATEGGTNFVSAIADSDGRSVTLEAMTKSPSGNRTNIPRGYLGTMNGRQALDLGTLWNATNRTGYGAAYLFKTPETTVTNVYTALIAFEDDYEAKWSGGRNGGPNLFGTRWRNAMTRGTQGEGVAAPIHYGVIAGRLQDGNYIDGVKYGTGSPFALAYCSKPVPDGSHLLSMRSASAAFDSIAGLGYCDDTNNSWQNMAFGGCKIGEVVFFDESLSDADRIRYENFLIAKWRGGLCGNITISGTATFSAEVPIRFMRLHRNGSGTTVTGLANLRPTVPPEAGNALLSVSGSSFSVAKGEEAVPGLTFSADGEIETPSDVRMARVATSGKLTKSGRGRLTLGVPDATVTQLAVQEGTLRLAPLEASGSYFHVVASSNVTTDAKTSPGEVTYWSDTEGRNGAQLTYCNMNYQWASRRIGLPTVATAYTNGLDVMDFGAFTGYGFNPDGTGAGMALSGSISASGWACGMHQLFAVWEDYAETKDIPCVKVGEEEKKVRGPSIYAAGSGWGYRGLGGGGAGYPLLGDKPVGSYYGAGRIKVDGASVDFATFVPSDGMHVLDWNIGGDGSAVDYVGGCRWVSSYDGASGSVNTGVWGGVRIGELIFYRLDVPTAFRNHLASALGAKWFGRESIWTFDAVSVAEGATFELPGATLEAQTLSVAGHVAAKRIEVLSGISREGSGVIAGTLTVKGGATVTIKSDGAGGVCPLVADSCVLENGVEILFDLTEEEADRLNGKTVRVLTAGSLTAEVSGLKVRRSAGMRSAAIQARLAADASGLAASFGRSGLLLLLR